MIGHKVAAVRALKQQQQEEQECPVSEPTTEATAEPSLASVFAMFGELLKEIKGSSSADSKDRALVEAERLLLEQQRFEMERDRENRNMPENKQHSGLSVFWPDVSIQKPKLKCKFLWVGYEVTAETQTPEEVLALNLLEPGEYSVTKADAKRIPFKITPKYFDTIDPATNRPKLEGLSVWFPCKGAEDRQNHLSMISYCRQAMGQALPTVSDLMAEVERLKRELAQERVGAFQEA